MSKRILVACEESQAVTIAFRQAGYEAYSCDLQACSGGHPEWHRQEDVRNVLGEPWDMILAFPPCTHLCCSGARWFEQKRNNGQQQSGIDFFMLFANISKEISYAIENPVGIMSTVWRKPDQIIQPYEFGDEAQKQTCIWLNKLPPLVSTKIVGRGEMMTLKSGRVMPAWYNNVPADRKLRSKIRSKTFPGIAKAMAAQWGPYV